jgi:hypothetical protein
VACPETVQNIFHRRWTMREAAAGIAPSRTEPSEQVWSEVVAAGEFRVDECYDRG